MIKNKCKHEWEKHTNSSQREEIGAIPAYFMCKKCKTLMTAPEVFQLEALEHLKGFQTKMMIAVTIIAILSLVVAIFK